MGFSLPQNTVYLAACRGVWAASVASHFPRIQYIWLHVGLSGQPQWLLSSPEHIVLLIDLSLEVEVSLTRGPKQIPITGVFLQQIPITGVFLHLLQHFVTYVLPLRLVGCRKLLLGLYMVRVLLKIISDDPKTCFKEKIQ